jgi:hypothetical protein
MPKKPRQNRAPDQIAGAALLAVLDAIDDAETRAATAKRILAETRERAANAGWNLAAVDRLRAERKRTEEQLEILFRDEQAFGRELELYRAAVAAVPAADPDGAPWTDPAAAATPLEAAIARTRETAPPGGQGGAQGTGTVSGVLASHVGAAALPSPSPGIVAAHCAACGRAGGHKRGCARIGLAPGELSPAALAALADAEAGQGAGA